MKIVENLIEPEACSGCGACVQICTHQVLAIKADYEGFLVPYVNSLDKCVDCGLCIKACQVHQHKDITPDVIQLSYVAQSRDHNNVKRSSSGGVFYTIAKEWIENQKGVVFGAAFSENHTVHHIMVDTVDGLRKLQGSKYVQSSIDNCYQKVKRQLQTGRKVLFAGTPCQIYGLKLFLNKEITNLMTIDIVCHGVTSPLMLQDYVRKVEQHEKRKCIGIRFRWKTPLFKSGSAFYMMMTMNKGFRIVRAGKSDPYMNIYLSGYAFRESCYICQFACPQRTGDITIGDCDSHHDYPHFHPEESNSTVIINTPKARDYWANSLVAEFDTVPMNLEREIECNKQLKSPFARPQQRDGIYSEFFAMGYDEIMKHYGREQGIVSYIKTRIMMHIPTNFRKIVAKVR